MTKKKGSFVIRKGDKVTIDLSEARNLMNVGTGVACILAEDALRLASRADQYLEGVIARAKAESVPKKRRVREKSGESPFPDGPPTFADRRAFKNDGS